MPLLFNAAKIAVEEGPSLLARAAELPLIRQSKWAEFVADLPKMSPQDLLVRAARDVECKGLEKVLSEGVFHPTVAGRDLEIHNILPQAASAEYAIKQGRKVIKTGYFQDEETSQVKFAIVRPANGEVPVRFRNEVGAYNMHYASAFTNDFPVSVVRPDGASDVGRSLVQERFGRSLNTQLKIRDFRHYGQSEADTGYGDLYQSHTFQNTFNYFDHVKDKLEQSVAERIAVFGDNDGFPRNFAVRVRPGDFRIANIDLDHRAFQNDFPARPAIEQFTGQPISDSTLGKLEHFLTKFTSAEGRQFMYALQFRTSEVKDIFRRTKSLLDTEHFPGPRS